MPFPGTKDGSPPAPRTPTGKRRSNNYGVWWVYKWDASTDSENWNYLEVRSTSIGRAHNAVVKDINLERAEDGEEPVKKNQVDLMAARLLNPPRDLLAAAAAADDDEDEEDD